MAGAGLLDELRDTYSKFLVLPPCASSLLALWTVFTYTVDAAHTAPILAVSVVVMMKRKLRGENVTKLPSKGYLH
jgi:hypothetical protein